MSLCAQSMRAKHRPSPLGQNKTSAPQGRRTSTLLVLSGLCIRACQIAADGQLPAGFSVESVYALRRNRHEIPAIDRRVHHSTIFASTVSNALSRTGRLLGSTAPPIQQATRQGNPFIAGRPRCLTPWYTDRTEQVARLFDGLAAH